MRFRSALALPILALLTLPLLDAPAAAQVERAPDDAIVIENGSMSPRERKDAPEGVRQDGGAQSRQKTGAAPQAAHGFPDALAGIYLRSIQEKLAERGYYKGAQDGKVSPALTRAVKAYQKSAGLKPTGFADQALINHLNFSGHSAAPAQSAAKPVPNPWTQFVQTRLAELGYDPGPADGFLGAKTSEAIRRFETANGMPATGMVTPELVAAMGQASPSVPREAPKNVAPQADPAEEPVAPSPNAMPQDAAPLDSAPKALAPAGSAAKSSTNTTTCAPATVSSVTPAPALAPAAQPIPKRTAAPGIVVKLPPIDHVI